MLTLFRTNAHHKIMHQHQPMISHIESSACLTHQHSSKKKQASTHRLFQNHTSTTSSTVIKNNALCPPHCNKKAKQQHLRAPCTSGADRSGQKRKGHCYATAVRHCDQQLSASTICYAIVTSNRNASPRRLRQSRSKTSPLPSSDRMEWINAEQINSKPQS